MNAWLFLLLKTEVCVKVQAHKLINFHDDIANSEINRLMMRENVALNRSFELRGVRTHENLKFQKDSTKPKTNERNLST